MIGNDNEAISQQPPVPHSDNVGARPAAAKQAYRVSANIARHW